MSNLKKALSYGLIVSLGFNLVGFFVNILSKSFATAINDILHVFPISFTMFFIPCVLSVIYFNYSQFKTFLSFLKHYVKPICLTIIVMYLILFSIINLKKDFKIPFYNITFIANSIIAGLIYIFSTLIIYLYKSSKKSKTKKIIYQINYFNLSITWLVITIIYISLHSYFGHGFKNPNLVVASLLGLLVSISTILSYKWNLRINKPKLVYSIIYLINCFVVFMIHFLIMKYVFSYDITFTLNKFIQGVVIFSPYYLLIALSTHTLLVLGQQNKEKKELKLLSLESSLKYQHLKSQLSPHFLFNNISVLTGLIEENQEKAILFSNDLAEIYRYFLDQENKDLVTLSDELSFAKRYFNLLKIRYENAIIINIENNTTEERYIVPLALQQLIENIIKHNEVSQEHKINITITTDNNSLRISNHINPKSSITTSNSSGIENIKKRFHYFTNEIILVEDNKKNFNITLPLITITT